MSEAVDLLEGALVVNQPRTLYARLHVTNRTQAALYALRQGWATLDEPPGKVLRARPSP